MALSINAETTLQRHQAEKNPFEFWKRLELSRWAWPRRTSIAMRPSANVVLCLDHTQILVIEQGRGLRLSCACGSVWITVEGDRQDYLIAEGQELRLNSRGRVVVQAYGPCRLRMELPDGYACLKAVSMAQ